MRSIAVILMTACLILSICACPSAWGEKVLWDAITSGGVIGSSSGSHIISSSAGQTGVGVLEGTSFRVYSGFWNPWLTGQVGTGFEVASGLPTRFQLHRNYPNPFDRNTTIRYDISSTSRVTLELYDIMGRSVHLLTDVVQEPGYYTISWNGRDNSNRRVGSGIYFCRMRARGSDSTGYSAINEMLLLK